MHFSLKQSVAAASLGLLFAGTARAADPVLVNDETALRGLSQQKQEIVRFLDTAFNNIGCRVPGDTFRESQIAQKFQSMAARIGASDAVLLICKSVNGSASGMQAIGAYTQEKIVWMTEGLTSLAPGPLNFLLGHELKHIEDEVYIANASRELDQLSLNYLSERNADIGGLIIAAADDDNCREIDPKQLSEGILAVVVNRPNDALTSSTHPGKEERERRVQEALPEIIRACEEADYSLIH